ncbi:glycosyltransferase [Glutamicibacter mishrai]|uniref:glycosyltransferase n=1 Tax=Glutamicibacter mishrai TaxID=1775880 RepID=UPI003F792594
MRILHVTECYAGGVSRAINSIAENFDADHHLLYSGDDAPSNLFSSTDTLPTSIVSRIIAFKRAVNLIRPDIVHAHSSWAGLYTRLLPTQTPIIYEPHCFVFDDPRRPRLLKSVYRGMESLLSINTKITVALTAHEAKLAKSLRPNQKVMQLSNVPTISASDLAAVLPSVEKPGSQKPFTISMVGRVAPQKDPDFFAQVAEIASAAGQDWNFTWIGGADNADDENDLKHRGINVTGWLDKASLISALETSDVYFHSASYEGFPLSVLDAAAMDLPIIVRELACFEGFDLHKIGTPEAAYESLKSVEQSADFQAKLRNLARTLTEEMSVKNQQRELQSIYGEALS